MNTHLLTNCSNRTTHVKYSSQIKSIRNRFPVDVQKRKLNALVNNASRELSLLPSSATIARQQLSNQILGIRKAISEVNFNINNQQF